MRPLARREGSGLFGQRLRCECRSRHRVVRCPHRCRRDLHVPGQPRGRSDVAARPPTPPRRPARSSLWQRGTAGATQVPSVLPVSPPMSSRWGPATDYSVPVGLSPGTDPVLMIVGFSSRGPTSNPAAPRPTSSHQGGASSRRRRVRRRRMSPTPARRWPPRRRRRSGARAGGRTRCRRPARSRQRSSPRRSMRAPPGPTTTGVMDSLTSGIHRTRCVRCRAVLRACPRPGAPQGSVRNTAEMPIEVVNSGEPLGISVRLDGQPEGAAGRRQLLPGLRVVAGPRPRAGRPDRLVVAESTVSLELNEQQMVAIQSGDRRRFQRGGGREWTLRVIPFSAGRFVRGRRVRGAESEPACAAGGAGLFSRR